MPPRIAPNYEPIPGYRLIERLGRGGFGEVWKCEAPGGMFKAIKFVYGNLDEATENGKPAEQELKALNRVKTIRHPYILTLERYDIIEGQLIIVMELADRNLFDRFRECRDQGLEGIPREELLRYMEEAAEALDLMNSKFQLQHLDIKPQNIFLVYNHIKVADFGLAKDLEGMQATLTGGVTPVYAAPETFECRVTRFCDQYSLAIVFQELLTGQRPFSGSTARQLMMQHITSAPDLASLPPADRPIIGRALSKKPDARFPTCAEMVCLLVKAGRPSEAAAASHSPPIQSADTPQTRVAHLTLGSPSKRPAVSEPAPALSGRARLPSLTTGRGLAANAVLTHARNSPPERTGAGELVPAAIIGLGQFGHLVLQRLRRAVKDRFGSASLPHLRMLCIDTDAEALQAGAGSSAGLEADEVLLKKLNRPAHCKGRDDLPDVSSWLNPQLLYRIPRQPATTGVRAFGRLAFCDHYRSFSAKFRSDVEAAVSDTSLVQAAERTGLELRSNVPRVYVISSLMGGTGGGMFIDVAYAARLQLRLLGYANPDVRGVLFAPPVDDETPRSIGIANTFAALTELLHFSSANSVYEALFDAKEGPISDRERPFQSCLLVPLPKSGESSSLRPALGQALSHLMQSLLAPAGREIDRRRAARSSSVLQVFGSFRFSWPRRALLERSARRCCERVLADWTGKEVGHLTDPVRTWLDGEWAERRLGPEHAAEQLRVKCQEAFNGDPAAGSDAVAASLEERSRRSEVDADELLASVERLTQLVGQPDATVATGGPGRVTHVIDQQAKLAAAAALHQIAAMTEALIDAPTWRLAGAEELVKQLTERVRRVLEQLQPQAMKLGQESVDWYVKMLSQSAAVEAMSRGSRKSSAVREIAASMRSYARKRIECQTHHGVIDVYRAMTAFGPDFQRECQRTRQQLDDLRQLFLKHSAAGGQGHLGPERSLLPPGCRSLDDAADRLASALTPEDLSGLDQALHGAVRSRYPGLLEFCKATGDQVRAMAEVLLSAARPFVEPRLGPGNAAAAFLATHHDPHSAENEIALAFDHAFPEAAGPRVRPEHQLNLVSVPEDADGRSIGAMIRESQGKENVTIIVGSEDIVVHREFDIARPEELAQLGKKAKEVFVHFTNADQAAPHARHDVNWRIKLEE